ncbi:NAD(P)-dependent oxidoreductase [Pseudomonas frederiksbergensis]|nr:NAD(P)-dependent oxidoreductase [Pseudomonas frederiksbergensis]
MKVLIIGSTSVIGRSLAARLVAQNNEVRLAGRREADISFDLTDWEDCPAPDETFDVVVHIAADFGGATDKDFVRAELVNAVGTLSACSLAHRINARHFILLSSIFATYSAADPYYGIYALSKRHSEEAAQLFCAERNIDLTILRPSQVYDDAGLCRPHQEFLYLIADKAQKGMSVELYGTNDARRNYIHLSDLTETIARVAEQRQVGVFACIHPHYVRLSEMANAAYYAFGTAGQITFLTDKPDLSDLPQTDDFELYSKISFWPGIDIKDGYKRIKTQREKCS